MEIRKKDSISLPPFKKDIVLLRSRKNTDWSHDYYKVKQLHKRGLKGQGVRVAVLDTGLDLTHDSFKKAIREGRLYAKDARLGKFDPHDVNGHGTWCVSRFISDGTGVLGFAPETEVISYKVLNDNGTGNIKDIMNGVSMAIEDRCHIISTSIGWNEENKAFKKLVDKAAKKNIVWMSAAGNDGKTEDIDYPGLYEDIFSVGSHSEHLKKSRFSDWGIDLDLYSSGEAVLGAYINNQDAYLQGTSMATPSAGALLSLIYFDLLKKYGRIDRAVLKKISYCL